MSVLKKLDKKLIAITGSSGFIGGKLAQALSNSNLIHLVRSINNENNSFQVECDFLRLHFPPNCLSGVATVFHLAAVAHDMRNPTKNEGLYRIVNVEATVKLAELAVLSGVKSFIFVSSVKAGGSPRSGRRINVDNICEPEGIYGSTKREAELRLLEIGRKSGMHVSIIRPSLVYGPNVKGNLKLMLSGIKRGWFPPLPEIGNYRSMIHIDDLVRAILLVDQDDRANLEIFIATDGVPHSSREIYNAMCDVVGKPHPNWSVPKILFDIVSLMNSNFRYKVEKLLGNEYYSSEKLQKLGFKAQKTLKDMNETSF